MNLRAAAAKHMLENIPINILLCGARDMVITYANKKSRDTLDSLTSLLPAGVNGSTIVGKCIDVFHKNPQHQRRILGDRSNFPHQATIRLGREFLELQIMEVQGGQLMLTWTVITAAERLKRMVDKMPINIMMADPETFDIVFMNATSLNTLRSIEQHLPVKADQVVGSNIDIFHKHPAHQRGLMADPKNLPHRAKIRVGPEWLELNVAAIVDDQGSYLGPMVSWSVITSQVQVADTVQQIATALASASTELSQNSHEMSKIISRASEQAGGASVGAAQASANMQSVASASEEMSASVQEIASSMNRSQTAVSHAASKAAMADQSARSLDAAASSMGSIIELIKNIAGQINLLALNATIESARAGEAGRGFAVVASEVKALATQTTKATEDIAREIGNMQGVSHEVIAALGSIKGSVEEVSQCVTGVASAIEEQTAVTREISANMQTASTGVDSVTQNIGGIADATRQADEATRQVLEAARMLSEQAERLDSEMKGLLK